MRSVRSESGAHPGTHSVTRTQTHALTHREIDRGPTGTMKDIDETSVLLTEIVEMINRQQ